MPDTAVQKSELRDRAERIRKEAHAQRADAAAASLSGRFLDSVGNLPSGSVVSLYWPMQHEMDVRPLMADLSARGVWIALPVMDGQASPLKFRAWSPGENLVSAPFGVREPSDAAEELTPDIVAVPLLAFDQQGNRLGYGGGYYDRTLAHFRQEREVLAIGVAYDEQEFPSVPVDAGDERLDMVVTDRRTIRPAK